MMSRSPRYKSLFLAKLFATVLVCLIILPASDSVGQGIDRERVAAEIERTDEIISQAQEQLRSTNDSRVAMLLRQAIETQERAREALEGRRFGMALEFTRKARELAHRAIGQLVRSDEDKALVEQQLERTEEILEQAGALAYGVEAARVRLHLEEAIRLQDRARDFYSENKLREALQLTRRAQEMGRKALQSLNSEERQREAVRRYLERCEELIETAREQISESGSRQASALYEAGLAQVERSREMFETGQFEEAGRLAAQGMAKVNRALRLVDNSSAEESSLRAIEIAQAQHDRLRERARELSSRDADRILDESADKLQRARRLHENGEYQRALVVVRVVMELNQQAGRTLGEW